MRATYARRADADNAEREIRRRRWGAARTDATGWASISGDAGIPPGRSHPHRHVESPSASGKPEPFEPFQRPVECHGLGDADRAVAPPDQTVREVRERPAKVLKPRQREILVLDLELG